MFQHGSYTVLDALDAHIAILDEEGVILFTNKAWREFAVGNGVGWSEVSDGVNYLDVCDAVTGQEAGQAQTFARGIRAVIARERANYLLEYPCDSPEEHRWFIGRITRFEENGASRIVVAHENITDRKKIEAEVVDSKINFSTVFRASPISIALSRIATDEFIDVNDEWEKLTGYSREEVVGRRATALHLWYDPADRMRIVNMIQEQIPVQGVEVKLRRRFGNAANVLFSAVTIDLAGERCLLSMALDITYSKRVERELRQTNERYRELFEHSGTGIIIVDEHGTYLMANVKAAAFFGRTPDDIVGTSMRDFLPPETAQRYLDFNRKLLDEGGHREHEDTFEGPEGAKTFLIVDQCLKDEAGRNFAVQSSSIDITDRRRAEAELQQSGQRLHALSHRLLEIQETERKHIAYELHDEIGQILTAVKLNLHGIQQFDKVKDIPQKMSESLALVEHSLQQVRALSVDLHPWMLDQLGLIPSLRWHLDHHAQRSKLKMTFNAGESEERFPAEVEITCFRVVQEALTNIIRHAQATEVLVTLTRNDTTLSVMIVDNGIGFDPDTITVEPGSARGFGLLSMEERVTLVNGTFRLSSKLNGGTRINFSLPVSGLPA